MDSFFDKLSRKLAMSMSRRDSLLFMAGTTATGLLAACGSSNSPSCSNGEMGCGNGCCPSTQTCCNTASGKGCCDGYCCGNFCCSFGQPVCCYFSNCTFCCPEGQVCGACSTCVDPADGTVREAHPSSPAMRPHASL